MMTKTLFEQADLLCNHIEEDAFIKTIDQEKISDLLKKADAVLSEIQQQDPFDVFWELFKQPLIDKKPGTRFQNQVRLYMDKPSVNVANVRDLLHWYILSSQLST